MVDRITRQGLQELQVELRAEFWKLNKRFEGLEQLLAASRPYQSDQPNQAERASENRAHPSTLQQKHQATTSSVLSKSVTCEPAIDLEASEKELMDHYFRTFAVGVEAKHWEEEEGALGENYTTVHDSSQRNLTEANKTASESNSRTVRSTSTSALRARVKEFVSRPVFNGALATLIFLNSVTLGVQTDHMAKQKLKEVPQAFKAVEYTFCCIFALEILLKLFAYGSMYFTSSAWKWNVFDTLLVSMTIVVELLDAIISVSFSNFAAIRILRALRVVRIVRVVRLLRIIGELRAVVASVLGSLRSLCWTVLLLFSIIYIMSIYFTQLLIEERASGNHDMTDYTHYYGSLARSILTLYETISGGLDWDVAMSPIRDISPFHGVIFVLYIAFTILAIMNVVTGVFVESALQSSREDREVYIVNQVRELVVQMKEQDGSIRWEKFQAKLATEEMREVFQHIDVDMKEAPGLFRLLDLNDKGVVDSEEFLDGILKLGGPAKSLDLALMMREIKRLTSKVQHIVALKAASTVYQTQPQPKLSRLRSATASRQNMVNSSSDFDAQRETNKMFASIMTV